MERQAPETGAAGDSRKERGVEEGRRDREVKREQIEVDTESER